MPLWPQAAAQSRNSFVSAVWFWIENSTTCNRVLQFWVSDGLFSRGCKSLLTLGLRVRWFASRLTLATSRVVLYGEARCKHVHQLASFHLPVSGKLKRGDFIRLPKGPGSDTACVPVLNRRNGDCIDWCHSRSTSDSPFSQVGEQFTKDLTRLQVWSEEEIIVDIGVSRDMYGEVNIRWVPRVAPESLDVSTLLEV